MKLAFTDNLTAGMVVAEDVLSSNKDLLFCRGTPLDRQRIDLLKKHQVRFVHVSNRLHVPYSNGPIRISSDFEIPQPAPLIAPELRDEAIESLEEIFTTLPLEQDDLHASSVQVIKQIDTIVEQLVDTLTGDKNTLVNINDLKSYDEYTYHHSLSVAVLSIAIGQHLGYDRYALNDLGRCAIMHDIGKTAIPIEIVQKPTRLSEQEYHIMQTHSLAGYHYLLESKIMNPNVLAGVLYHHEKMDGTGYPFGFIGDRIPPFGRIISVADVYDALTSNRPYRQPNQPAEAIEYIMGGIDSSFDYDIVHAFVKKLDIYPIGSFVRLSNGLSAVVVENENQMRPVVRLLETGDYLDLYRNRHYHSIVIRRFH